MANLSELQLSGKFENASLGVPLHAMPHLETHTLIPFFYFILFKITHFFFLSFFARILVLLLSNVCEYK